MGFLEAKRKILFYIGGERRVVLVDGDVSFELFQSKIRHISGKSSYIKIM